MALTEQKVIMLFLWMFLDGEEPALKAACKVNIQSIDPLKQ